MIGIDRTRFDLVAIRELYEYDPAVKQPGAVVRYVRNTISDLAGELNGHELTRFVFREWFYDADGPSYTKISEFLLRDDTSSVIEECARLLCLFLWDDEGLYRALLQCHAAVNDACALGEWDTRLDRMSRVLDERHVRKGMFEVRDAAAGAYRELRAADLLHPVRRGTLCASKDRLKSLRITRNAQLQQFHKDCKLVFDYEWFSRACRDKVLAAMGVDVCPYCNRQYVSTWGTGKRRSTADIDHFYGKDRFPYLALSLFNFVPSCQVCNARFKLTTDFYARPHANPHDGGFGESARFEYDSIDALVNLVPTIESVGDEEHHRARLFSLHVDPDEEAIANSIGTFNLNELYAAHNDYARELIHKARIFGPSQIDEYLSEYGAMFSSREELYRAIYGNYLNVADQGRRPLARMTQDLLRDLGVTIELGVG